MDRSDIHEDQTDQLKVVETAHEVRQVAVPLKAGAAIGKYELVEKIGAGAMSEVYKARDVALNRPVAIKFLLTDALDGKESFSRFKQEARALGTLEHRNIVKVHETDVTADGAPYIVMNYLSGVNLAESLANQGKLSPGRFLALMLQACAALEYAHANGIVHRDIKPSNFILVQENGSEVVKLIDFGIAKNMLDETAMTKTGNVFGTPLYMSPEQCAGEKLDKRSDIYSLGCVMYEALTGRAPLIGDNSLSTMQKHLKDTPERLSTVLNIDNANQNEIQSLDNIVMKCLAKKPADRYQKISDVTEDLNMLLQGKKPPLRLALPGLKKRIITVAAIGISLCVGALTILEFSKKQNIPNLQSKTLVTATPSQEGRTLEREAVTESTGESKAKEIEQPAQVIDPNLLAQKRHLFRVVMEEARNAARDKDWKLALQKAKEALPISIQLGKSPARTGEIYWHIAQSEFVLRDYSAARRDFQRALDTVSGGPDNASKHWKYQALIGLGKTASVNNEVPEALNFYEAAYKTVQATSGSDAFSTDEKLRKHKAVCMGYIGDMYQRLNRMDEAKTYWRASLSIRPENPVLEKKLRELQ